jgi:plasmid stabilization system protein ParE
MSYALIVLPVVAEHLTEALREREARDTRRALLAEIDATLEKIRDHPRRFPIAYSQVHRALTPRFHFAVFFEIVEERAEVVIVGVLHQRRDPASWPGR